MIFEWLRVAADTRRHILLLLLLTVRPKNKKICKYANRPRSVARNPTTFMGTYTSL